MLRASISCLVLLLLLPAWSAGADAAELPNILWVTSEDNGPHVGCYGDEYADTPSIDALAKKGVRYLNAWSTAPVCAPARTTLISGLYPPSTGSEHMRSMTSLPAAFRMYPQYLRDAGYYVTNNNKEDYNLEKKGKVWDESNRKAHWRNRKKDQPFFAIFNITTSHESQLRKRPHKAIHDPAGVRVPAYHPDTPEVRRDWAQYYDKITEMDRQVGKRLREIEDAGLSDDTIIFYYGDHGSGMPRSKRWPYNSGLRVPLVVYIPDKYKSSRPKDYIAGGASDRLVGFIDLPPTLLSLVGVVPPKHFQGHAFLGTHEAAPQKYIYGFRGRMDERYDMLRVVRDKRYLYIRNYMPHKVYGQYINYMFQTPTTRVWHRMYHEGKLKAPQTYFWERKPAEELYDLDSDPDEVHNLAGSPGHQETLARLREAQRSLALKIRDVGFLPEGEIHSRSSGSTPYEMGHDATKFPAEKIMSAAELAAGYGEGDTPALQNLLADSDSAVRYWAAMGLLIRGEKAVSASRDSLRKALGDSASSVRIIAAQALGQYGSKDDIGAALEVLITDADQGKSDVFAAMLALNALDHLDDRAQPVREKIRDLPRRGKGAKRTGGYPGRLLDKILSDLDS